jgi:HAD superfamily hydrolase (TIGR01662 family)
MGNRYNLVIFDIDGTLADRDTSVLLSGVFNWFSELTLHYKYKLALATNQGGVGLRYWMEKDGFGNPGGYPDAREAAAHIASVISQLPQQLHMQLRNHVYMSFAYRSKKTGVWGAVPPGANQRWRQDWRKPAPGMLLQAMRDYGVVAQHTLMVGDRDEDHKAAIAANCSYMHRDTLFGDKA